MKGHVQDLWSVQLVVGVMHGGIWSADGVRVRCFHVFKKGSVLQV